MSKKQAEVIFRLAWLPLAVYMVTAAILAGCGDLSATSMNTANGESGSGMIISGVGVGGTGVVKSALQAPAIDTGLITAVVFADTNGNRLHDQDEPFVITGQDGSYSGLAEAAQFPVLIQAVGGVTVVKANGRVVADSYIVEAGLEQQR